MPRARRRHPGAAAPDPRVRQGPLQGVDAGDRPEFSLYLPGRGGNLRLGMRVAGAASGAAVGAEAGGSAKWFNDVATIDSR